MTTPDRIIAGGGYGQSIAPAIGVAHGEHIATRVVIGRPEDLPSDALKAIEARADTDSLGDLQQRRRTIMAQLAPLKALHGHNGIWDDKRKSFLEAMKVKARMALMQDGSKVTEGAVDAMAYADEQYARFIDDGIAARIEYITLQNDADEIAERVRSREIELLAYNGELKLSR